MSAKKITPYFILSGILVVAGYDIWAYMDSGQEGTISYLLITDWIYNYPAFVAATFFVLGHLFWPLAKKPCPKCGHVK